MLRLFQQIAEILHLSRSLSHVLTLMHGDIHDLRRIAKMSQADIDELKGLVADQTTEITSASVLLNKLADMVEAAADDPDEIRQIIADVRSNNSALAKAVTDNTPTDAGSGGGDVPPGDGGGDVPPVDPGVDPATDPNARRRS